MDIDTGEKDTEKRGRKARLASSLRQAKDDEESEEIELGVQGKGTKRKESTAQSEPELPAKKRRVTDESNQIPRSEDKIISFMIDGKKVATFQSTLTKIPNTKLSEMFSSPEPGLPKVADCYLLERPRKAFTGVLNYLRSGKFYVPKEPEAKADLEAEIEYWGLSECYKRDSGGWALFEGSQLLEKAHQRQLNEWYGKVDQRWKLLYKASRDGWEALDFHKKCDRKGPTITVISANGFLFGGYTPLSWESRDAYAWDEDSWIFSLTNPSNEPVKMANVIAKGKDFKYSIYDAADHGPTFGGGYDIAIQSNANGSNQNYTNIGYSYLLPGKIFGSEESKNFMTGSYHFSVAEIEVFSLADTSANPESPGPKAK